MDRQLVVEFPWLILRSAPTGGPGTPFDFKLNPATDVRKLAGSSQLWVAEQKIDLSGYVQDSLTVGFRRSFEQKGGSEFISWKGSYDPVSDNVIETTIISSVPFNDNQLISAVAASPGFTIYSGAIDPGNFNRQHITHGSYQMYYANSIVGSSAFSGSGSATMVSVVDNYFSSLEPTAADCLYCYRVVATGAPGEITEGVQTISIPAKRVILDAFTVEEPDLEYMMRLKRSYELANQV